MTTPNVRTASFAPFLGLAPRKPKAGKPPKQNSSAPTRQPKAAKVSNAGGKKPARRTQDAASPFAHLAPGAALKPKATPPAQRAASRGSAARAVVDAYARATVTRPAGPQTSPTMSPAAERDLAARIIAAGQRRRGES